MSHAYSIPVHPAARPPRRVLAAAALALIGGWTLYAAPPACLRALSWFAATPAQVTFGEIHARRGEIDGQTVLYVEGSLANAAGRTLKTPALRIALIGDDGRPVYSWKAKVSQPQLEAGRETTFQTRLLAPPEKFKRIEVGVE